MSRFESLREAVGDTWFYALIGGLASMPLTAASYWQTGSEMALSPVLFGGLLAGYLAECHADRPRGVGVRTGLVGGLPIVWVVAEIFAGVSALGGPSWFVAAGTLLTIVALLATAAMAFALAALVGVLGARIGRWLASRTGRRRSSVADA